MDVFLVAQSRLLREALGKVLDKTTDIRVVASIAFDSTVQNRVAELNPDVIVIEPGLCPKNQMVPLIPSLPTSRVVVIVFSADEDVSLRSCSGASPYVLRDPSVAEVAAAVRATARGS
jgi:DNA-binding NarL/FixJ family response regulator